MYLITILIRHEASHEIGSSSHCHYRKATEHCADSERIMRGLGLEEELGSDDVSDG
jgi:hypothetical protein